MAGLDEQYLTVRRSMRYNGTRHKTEIGTTKRSKVRTVDFCDTLAEILRAAKAEQHKNRFQYGELYHLNYYTAVKEKDRSYYEVYSLPRTAEVPEGYKELSFVCVRPDGMFESVGAVGQVCQKARKQVGFPLPYAAAHLHEQPAVGRGKAHRCAGAVRTLRCQYHDVNLRSR